MKKQIGKFVFAWWCVASAGVGSASAQGGWDAWDIFLRDNTRKQASPLRVADNKTLTRCLGEIKPECVIAERSQIDYIAFHENSVPKRELPPAPVGDFDTDLIVKMNGEQIFGAVAFNEIRFSTGTIRQNETEINLRDIAYIKFAAAQISGKKTAPNSSIETRRSAVPVRAADPPPKPKTNRRRAKSKINPNRRRSRLSANDGKTFAQRDAANKSLLKGAPRF